MRKLVLGKAKQVVEELKVWFIVVGAVGGRSATSAVVDVGDLFGDGTDVLHIETSLKGSRGVGWALTIVDGSAAVALVLVVLGSIGVHELGEIILVGNFFKESTNAHESVRVGLSTAVVIQARQTGGSDIKALTACLATCGCDVLDGFSLKLALGESEESGRGNEFNVLVKGLGQAVLKRAEGCLSSGAMSCEIACVNYNNLKQLTQWQ